jgi:WD40 repeat protein/tetratricopeptide (TPR) repeat protein
MTQGSNPYIAGNPVTGDNFFDREDILDWVEQHIKTGTRSLALIGPRRIGKTSLLLRIQHVLPAIDFLAIYFELQPHGQTHISLVVWELAKTIGKYTNLESPSLEKFQTEYRQEFSDFLDRVYETLSSEGKKYLVILFDEFEALEQDLLEPSAAANALRPFLRNLLAEKSPLVYIIALGRFTYELTDKAVEQLKGGTKFHPVWLMERDKIEAVIRQAEYYEPVEALQFTDEAVNYIYEVTRGFPFFTQLICHVIWRRKHPLSFTFTGQIPRVSIEDVDEAIPIALEEGEGGLEWFWRGLSLTQKIYWSALAQAIKQMGDAVSHDQIMQIIQEEAERLVIPGLSQAAEELVRIDFLTKETNQTYCFSIEFLRLWIQQEKPLYLVKQELDSLDKDVVEDKQQGEKELARRNFDKAIAYFKRALEKDPNHHPSLHLLGVTLFHKGDIDDSIIQLEKAYRLGSSEVRADITRALMNRVEQHQQQGNEDGVLETLERLLEINPEHTEAQKISSTLWLRRGETALNNKQLEEALNAFKRANAIDRAKEVEQELEIQRLETEAQKSEAQKNYDQAAISYQQLLDKYQGDRRSQWQESLEQCQREIELRSGLEERAQFYKQNQRWGDAIATYKILLAEYKNESKNEIWQRELARCETEQRLASDLDEAGKHLNERRFTDAINKLTALIDERPDYERGGVDAKALLYEAEQKKQIKEDYEQKNRWPEAIQEYTALSQNASSHLERATWMREIERCKRQEAISNEFALGRTYLDSQDWPQAKMAFKKVIEYDPEYVRNGLSAAHALDLALNKQRPQTLWQKALSLFWRLLAFALFVMLFASSLQNPEVRERIPWFPLPTTERNLVPIPSDGENSNGTGSAPQNATIEVTRVVTEEVTVTLEVTRVFTKFVSIDIEPPKQVITTLLTSESVAGNLGVVERIERPFPGPAQAFDVTYGLGGNLIAVATPSGVELYQFDNTRLVWDRIDEGQMNTATQVNRIAFSRTPDINTFVFAAGLSNGDIQLWNIVKVPNQDTYTIEKREPLQGVHTATVIDLAFSANGFVLASASTDNSVKLWCIGNTRIDEIITPRLENVGSSTIAFYPSQSNSEESFSTTLISASGDEGMITLWNVRIEKQSDTCIPERPHGEQIESPEMLNENRVTDADFSPDGKSLVIAAGDQVRIWDVHINGDNKLQLQVRDTVIPHEATVNSVSILPGSTLDSLILGSASEDGKVQVWQVRNDIVELQQTIFNNGDSASSIAFSPNKLVLAYTLLNSGLRLRHVNIQETIRQLGMATSSALSPANNENLRFLATGFEDGTVEVQNLNDGQLQTLSDQNQRINKLGFYFDNNFGLILASASDDGTVGLYKFEENSFRLLNILNIGDQVKSLALALHPTNNILFLAVGRHTVDNEKIQLWEITKGENDQFTIVKSSLQPTFSNSDVNDVALASNESSLLLAAVFESNYSPRVWNLDNLRTPIPLGTETSADYVSISPDGTRIAAASSDGTLWLWDSNNDQLNPSPIKFPSFVDAPESLLITFDNTNKFIAAVGLATGQLMLVDDNQDPGEFMVNGVLTTIAVASDGSLIVARAADNTVTFWAVSE